MALLLDEVARGPDAFNKEVVTIQETAIPAGGQINLLSDPDDEDFEEEDGDNANMGYQDDADPNAPPPQGDNDGQAWKSARRNPRIKYRKTGEGRMRGQPASYPLKRKN